MERKLMGAVSWLTSREAELWRVGCHVGWAEAAAQVVSANLRRRNSNSRKLKKQPEEKRKRQKERTVRRIVMKKGRLEEVLETAIVVEVEEIAIVAATGAIVTRKMT